MLSQYLPWSVLLSSAVAALLGGLWASTGQRLAAAPTDQTVENTRKQVRMLDDLYKTTVVFITDQYVDEDSDMPAGTAAKKIFEAMKKKGWHDVRLIDGTNKPIEEENFPRDGFEKRALKELQNGKDYIDEVVTIDGKRRLLAATPIPVVSEKCIMCHEHYKEYQKEGKIIGMLGYSVPID